MLYMNNRLADYVRTARARAGLTQEELAEAIDRTTGYIGILEMGRVDRPKPATLRRLAEALNVPLNDLVETTGQIDKDDEDLADLLQRITSLPSHAERVAAYDRLPERVRQAVLRAAQDYLLVATARLEGAAEQQHRGQ